MTAELLAQLSSESLIEKMNRDIGLQANIVPFLASYHLVPQVLSELILDEAIASIQCTPEEIAGACETYYRSLKLMIAEQREEWRSRYSLTQNHIEQLATRELRIEKFKREMWQNKLENYFLMRKRQLDRVIYSLLRTSDRELAIELFFRIHEGEQSFAELARCYSQGPEAQTGGLTGPVEFGSLSPNLAQLLYTMPEGQANSPVAFGDSYAIVRVEKRLPVQLNEVMEQRLLQELFESWFQGQLEKLAPQDLTWLGRS